MTGIIRQKKTAYDKKILFNDLLKKDFSSNTHLINATYQWKNPSLAFSLSVKNNTFRLKINLNCLDDNLMFDGDRADEAIIRYRAYFISNYIYCLETAHSINPQTYFNGLVNIEAICCLDGKEIDVYSPLSPKKTKLCSIDIYCAIRALTRLQIDCNNWLPCDVKQYCETQINSFIMYTQLPEVEYSEGAPVYSLQRAIKSLRDKDLSGKINLRPYSLFSNGNMHMLWEMSWSEFIQACDEADNPFWAGVAIRFLAFSGGSLDGISLNKTGCISNYLIDYHNSCISYSREYERNANKLIDDNYAAIKRIVRCVERTASGTIAKCGALHYIQ